MLPKIIHVFIASPGDVVEERKIVQETIQSLNFKFNRLYSIGLVALNYEAMGTISGQGNIQEEINPLVEESEVVVGIFHNRFGPGSAEEIRYAIAHRDRIKLLLYFRKTDSPEEGLENFKRELKQDNILPAEPYENPQAFRSRIALDLVEAVLEMGAGLFRRRCLNRFFEFGRYPGSCETSVRIGYPPIYEHYGEPPKWDYNWVARLLPNVVYEDFKAIQKIEDALKCLGIYDYGSITIDNPKLWDPGNRIWLCIPRNPIAQHYLCNLQKTDKNRVNFRFESLDDGSRLIEWRPPGQSEVISVKSPQAKYLNKQRPHDKIRWQHDFGHIISLDYAILARFKNPYDSPEPFYHYFMAGIRGLGTWGVGWYIDRCYEELAKIAEIKKEEDLQILLEVEFQNFRIIRVTDVSQKDQAYFDHVNDDGVIQHHIEEHRQFTYYKGFPCS